MSLNLRKAGVEVGGYPAGTVKKKNQFEGSGRERNHRIIEWFGLEGTLKLIWLHLPCHQQGRLPPVQGAQSSIQPGLEP